MFSKKNYFKNKPDFHLLSALPQVSKPAALRIPVHGGARVSRALIYILDVPITDDHLRPSSVISATCSKSPLRKRKESPRFMRLGDTKFMWHLVPII